MGGARQNGGSCGKGEGGVRRRAMHVAICPGQRRSFWMHVAHEGACTTLCIHECQMPAALHLMHLRASPITHSHLQLVGHKVLDRELALHAHPNWRRGQTHTQGDGGKPRRDGEARGCGGEGKGQGVQCGGTGTSKGKLWGQGE